VLVGPDGSLIGKYRKVHLPGTNESRADAGFQQLEKRYFEYGDLGFPAFRVSCWHEAVVGMIIFNAGLIEGSCIVDPDGQIIAEARGLTDEVIITHCDLDDCRQGKTKMFDFLAYRRPEWYGPITNQTGAHSARSAAE
jgi:predicted amidohydrolase